MLKGDNQSKPGIPLFARFRTQLFVLLLLVFIPSLILTIRTNFSERRLKMQRTSEQVMATAKLAAAKQENFVRNAEQLLATVSQFAFLVSNNDRPFSVTHFENLRKLSPEYLDIGLIEADGALFCSTTLSNSLNYSNWSVFQRVSSTKHFAIGDFTTNGTTPEATLDFGYPIFNEKKEFQRVLYASLDLKRMQKTIDEVDAPLPELLVTLFDGGGNVLARCPDPGHLVGKSAAHHPFVNYLLRDEANVFEMKGIDGVQRLFGIATVSDGVKNRLWISAGVSSKTLFSPADQSLWNSLFLMGLVAIVAFGAAYFFAKHFFLRPLQSLVSQASLLAGGKWAPQSNPAFRKGELGELSSTFNDMALILEGQRKHIEKVNLELELRVRDRTRQLEQANQELESFSYSVSHDLRAPLRHIAGFVNMLSVELGNSATPKSQRFMKVIADAAKQMGQLIDELLVFSKMGRVEMQQTIVDTNKLVEEVIGNLHDEFKARNIVWKKGDLPSLQADPAMLRQVFVNLISNAIKYSQPRDPAEIEIGHEDAEDETVIFVRDNGVGFDMQFSSKLFGVFQRLHQADEFEGTGIGLANVRRIIQRHGGRTWANGVLNCGATFFFSLPKTKHK